MISLGVLAPAGTLVAGSVVSLDDQEQRHLDVRRIRSGSDVVVYDGAGAVGRGVVTISRSAASVAIDSVQQFPRAALTLLAVGAGDRDRFLFLAEKCTELGVSRLIPVETERSDAVATRIREASVAKARRRAREACKQSGNPWATQVDDPVALPELIGRFQNLRWFLADAEGGEFPALGAEESVGWIVGPEGGLSSEEREALIGARVEAVRLGNTVLRFETAGMVAVAHTMFRRGSAKQGEK